jgi:hypothetical protein
MKLRMLATVIVGGALLQGCVERIQHGGICRGRLVDAETRVPIQGAKLTLDGGSLRASTKSAEDGRFAVGPLKCSHFGIVVPPEPHVIPGCKHDLPPNLWLNLTVSKHHYGVREILVPITGTNVGDVLLRPGK